GLSFAAGYGLGVVGHALWRYLELPAFSQAVRRAVNVAVAAACVLAAAYFLWKASAWQDSIRALMGMEPSEGTRPLAVGFIAAAVFALVLLIARAFRLTSVGVSRVFARYVPQRVSLLV